MTNEQRINLNMALTVRNCIALNESVAKAIPRFMEQFLVAQTATNEIQNIGEAQGVNKTGLAVDKNKIKSKLIALAEKNSRKIATLAKFMNNDTLLREVQYKESQLQRLAEVTLIEKAQTIHDRVQANLEKLSDQGVTADTQKEFKDTIIALNNVLKTPRAGVGERKKATERLVVLFKTLNDALVLMDYAVEGVKDENIDFYNAYKTARKLVDTNAGNVALKATAVDLSNQEPIQGATFKLTHNGIMESTGNGAITKKTAAKGSFHIRNMSPGEYKILVKKAGYKDKILTITIEDGIRNEVKVELEKA